jgi:hypothetical protein
VRNLAPNVQNCSISPDLTTERICWESVSRRDYAFVLPFIATYPKLTTNWLTDLALPCLQQDVACSWSGMWMGFRMIKKSNLGIAGSSFPEIRYFRSRFWVAADARVEGAALNCSQRRGKAFRGLRCGSSAPHGWKSETHCCVAMVVGEVPEGIAYDRGTGPES